MQKKIFLSIVSLVLAMSLVGCKKDNKEVPPEVNYGNIQGAWIANDNSTVLLFDEDHMLYIGVNPGKMYVDNEKIIVNGQKQANAKVLKEVTKEEDADKFRVYKIEVEYEGKFSETRDLFEYNDNAFECTSGTNLTGIYIDYKSNFRTGKLTYTSHTLVNKNEVGYSYSIEDNVLTLVADVDDNTLVLTRAEDLDNLSNYFHYRLFEEGF